MLNHYAPNWFIIELYLLNLALYMKKKQIVRNTKIVALMFQILSALKICIQSHTILGIQLNL